MRSFTYTIAGFILSLTLLFAVQTTHAQSLNPNKVTYPSYQAEHRTNIYFPQVKEYSVMICDFHTHTMFSDGLVWPTQRVAEAWLGGLDAMALTDHIEYRPYRSFTNNDHNTSFEIAKPAALSTGLILIKGTEITRTQRTLGHYNALFINDANTIAVDDAKESIKEAKKQGAFITWNHPGWAVDSTYIKEFQEDLFKDGLIDGIEVYNNTEFYPRVLAWAIDKNLAIIAATDVHGFVESGTLNKNGVNRPSTLVLAKERSAAGIREALEARRTIAWFQNILAAREDIAKLFVESTLSVKRVHSDGKTMFINVTNNGSALYKMRTGNRSYTVPGMSSVIVPLPESDKKFITVNFENIFIYENKTLAHDLYFN